MKARDAIGRKTAQEQRHGIACKGPGITRRASLTSASFGGIAVLLFLGGPYQLAAEGLEQALIPFRRPWAGAPVPRRLRLHHARRFY
jgi:hypothetical protein